MTRDVPEVAAGRPLIELAKLCYAAGRPLLLVGRHGVGKSELLARAARELGIGFICRDLSLMEPPDLIGLPRHDHKVTRYSPPSFLPADGDGFLAFEELNRCPTYMRAPTLQLLTAGTLNDYTLPKGWLAVAAINPSEDGYEVEELDPALLSRFVEVHVVPDRGEWLEWARAEGVHPGVVAYVEANVDIFDTPESNPRAWDFVGRLLQAAEGRGPAERQPLRVAVAGLVGTARAAAFFKALDSGERPLSAGQIKGEYRQHRETVRAWLEAGRLDMIRGSHRALLVHLQPQQNYREARADSAAWESIGQFLADVPGDLREEAETFFAERNYEFPGPPADRRRRPRS
jgi:MoxR-like ATPase